MPEMDKNKPTEAKPLIYKKILLKLTGQIFKNREDIYNHPQTKNIVEEIIPVHERGTKIIIVIGGGNIFRGRELQIPGFPEDKSDKMGMLGTSMNGLYLQGLMECLNVKTDLFAATKMDYFASYYTREAAHKSLEELGIIIICCGMGRTLCTTDYASVAYALDLKAEAILKGTKVEGLYDKDPKLHKRAKLIPEITYGDALKLDIEKIFDNSGFGIAKDRKIQIPTHIFNIFGKKNFLRLMEGEKIGSKITP